VTGSLTGDPYRDPCPKDPRLAETCRLRDKLRDIYRELPPVGNDDPRVQAVLAEIRAVWA